MLVLPLERELGVPTWVVTGAFSLALLMSAALAPTVGRWCDRGRGPLLMQAGGVAAAALLVLWTLAPGPLMLYVVWAGLGLCMAATLYEPAFVIVGRAYADSTARLRALAAVTLFGGLASTVFLPLTAFLVAALGWRSAVLVMAALLMVSAAVTRALVFRDWPAATPATAAAASALPARDAGIDRGRVLFITSTFALASLTSAAFTTNLVPALGERGITPAAAALLGGLMGIMQLPGRALLLNGALAGSSSGLVVISFLLHGVGLFGVAFAPSMPGVGGATMVFALGAGLTTLVRPYVIQTMFSQPGGGHLNGRIARQQQLARAVGPIAIAGVAGLVGYALVFGVIGAGFVVVAIVSQSVLNQPRGGLCSYTCSSNRLRRPTSTGIRELKDTGVASEGDPAAVQAHPARGRVVQKGT